MLSLHRGLAIFMRSERGIPRQSLLTCIYCPIEMSADDSKLQPGGCSCVPYVSCSALDSNLNLNLQGSYLAVSVAIAAEAP